MSYIVTIAKDSDGSYIAYNEELQGIAIGNGKTVEEAKEDYFNTLNEIKSIWEEEGKELPEICKEKPIFKFDVSSLFEFYKSINVAGFANFVGINASLLRQYKLGNTYISDSQLKKIEDGVHKLGEELISLKLV